MTTTNRDMLAKAMTEKELQQNVIALARMLGWKTYHTFDSRRSDVGFPDIVAIHPEHHWTFVAELKREGKLPTEDQHRWISYFHGAGIRVFVWHPIDWLDGTIERILRGDPWANN